MFTLTCAISLFIISTNAIEEPLSKPWQSSITPLNGTGVISYASQTCTNALCSANNPTYPFCCGKFCWTAPSGIAHAQCCGNGLACYTSQTCNLSATLNSSTFYWCIDSVSYSPTERPTNPQVYLTSNAAIAYYIIVGIVAIIRVWFLLSTPGFNAEVTLPKATLGKNSDDWTKYYYIYQVLPAVVVYLDYKYTIIYFVGHYVYGLVLALYTSISNPSTPFFAYAAIVMLYGMPAYFVLIFGIAHCCCSNKGDFTNNITNISYITNMFGYPYLFAVTSVYILQDPNTGIGSFLLLALTAWHSIPGLFFWSNFLLGFTYPVYYLFTHSINYLYNSHYLHNTTTNDLVSRQSISFENYIIDSILFKAFSVSLPVFLQKTYTTDMVNNTSVIRYYRRSYLEDTYPEYKYVYLTTHTATWSHKISLEEPTGPSSAL